MKTSRLPSRARGSRETNPRRGVKGVEAGMKIVAAIEEATELLRSEGLDSNQLTVDDQLLIPCS
jgi:hypothetical protein